MIRFIVSQFGIKMLKNSLTYILVQTKMVRSKLNLLPYYYVWKQNLNFGKILKKQTTYNMKYSTLLTIHILDTSVSKYSFGHLTLLYPMACITQIYILKSLLNVSSNREPFHDQNTLALMRSLSTHYIYLIFLLLKWFIKMYNNVTLEED